MKTQNLVTKLHSQYTTIEMLKTKYAMMIYPPHSI